MGALDLKAPAEDPASLDVEALLRKVLVKLVGRE